MPELTLKDQFIAYRNSGKWKQDDLVKALEQQGFSSDDYDLPLAAATAKAKERLAKREFAGPPAATAQAPAPKPALAMPKPPFVTDADLAAMGKRKPDDALPAPKGTPEESAEAQSPEQQDYLAEQVKQHPEVTPKANIVPPTPLEVARRVVRAGAGALQGVVGGSAVGHAADVGSAFAERALDPFASDAEKAQHEKDIAKALKDAEGAKGTVIELAGGSEPDAWKKAGEALHKGEYKQALKAVTPQTALDAYHGVEQQRAERRVGHPGTAVGGAQFIGNALEDLVGVVGGLAEAANNIGGFTVEEEGKRRGEPAHESGKGLVALPGQAASLGKGLFSLDNNSLLTHPFSTFLTVVEPLRGVMEPLELGTKTKAAAKSLVDVVWQKAEQHNPGIVAQVEARLKAGASSLDNLRAYMEQAFEDGLSVRDKQQAGQLDLNINSPQAAAATILTAAERIAKQAEQGKIAPIEPDLTPTDVQVTPASPRGKALKAARAAREAATAEAARIAERRARDIEGAERTTDTAEARADTAGQRMGDAEAAASNAGVRAQARNADMEAALGKASEDVQVVADKPEAKIAKDVEFDRKRIDIENKQARMELQVEAARKRHAEATEAYDKAQENHQYYKDLEAKARDDYSEALATAETLRQKQAAITGRGKKSRAPALEKAPADAERLGTKLKEAVRKGDEAREKAAALQEKAIKANADAVTAKEVAAAQKLQHKAVIAQLDAQRIGLGEADTMAATKAAAEDVRRVQAAPTDMDGGTQWGPAPEGEMVIHDPNAKPADLTETNSALDDMILRKTDEAAAHQQEALLNGLDVRAMVPDEMQAIFPRTAGKTVLEAAKGLANHVAERNRSNPLADIEGVVLQMGVPKEAAAPFAKWLWAEEELRRIMHITEREGGVIRMPQTEVTRLVVEPGGRHLVEEGRVNADAAAEDMLAKTPNLEHREGIKELAHMQSHEFRPNEKPIGFRTDNPVFEQAVDDSYKAYIDQMMPEHLRTGEYARYADATGLGAIPAVGEYFAQLGEVVKPMSRDRFAARYLRQLDERSSQLLVHPSVQHAFENRFTKKLTDAGIHGAQMRELRWKFTQLIEDTKNYSVTGKNRFIEVLDKRTGKMLWDESDYFDAMKDLKQLDKIKADAINKFAAEMSDSVQGLGVMNGMVESAYGMFRDNHGAVDPAIFANPAAYAKKLANWVVDEGRMKPLMQPYSGKELAEQLRKVAKGEKDPVRAGAIDAYADELETNMVGVGDKSSLGSALPRWYEQAFNGTTLPKELVNLHMPKDIARAYASHFYMLSSATMLGKLGDAVQAILSRSKAGTVPENIAALLNNNHSNTLANMFRRHDPLLPAKVVNSYLITRRYLNGKLDGLDPALAADMRSLFKTDLRSSTFLSAELKKSKMLAHYGDILPFELGAKAKRLSLDLGHFPELPGLGIDYINGALRWAYQEMGDMPFRVEQALNSMKLAREKVDALEPGSSMDLPVSKQRSLRLVKQADGTIRVLDPMREKEPLLAVDPKSDAMRDILAHHGNFVQGQRFFDYNKIGAVPKYMRTPVLQPLSGIFTWFWLASDLPMLAKKGLLQKMMLEGDSLPTDSPAVRKMQAQQQMKLALSRAVLTTAGQQALDDQLKAEGIRRSVAFDKTDNSMIMRRATNPKYAYVRNLGPVLFTKPTMVFAQAGQRILQDLAFNDLADDPATLSMLLRPTNKELAAEADKSPDEEAHLANQRNQLQHLLLGETFNIKNLGQIIGLTGAPAVNTLLDVMNGRLSVQEAKRQFLAQMFGTTVERLMEVTGAAAGVALDSPSLLEASAYGKPSKVSSLRGGVGGVDESGELLQWALNFVTGMGFKTVNVLGDHNDVTGKKTAGAIAGLITEARKGVSKDWVDEANRHIEAARLLVKNNPTPENKTQLTNAIAVRNQLEQTVKWWYKHMNGNLVRQFKELP